MGSDDSHSSGDLKNIDHAGESLDRGLIERGQLASGHRTVANGSVDHSWNPEVETEYGGPVYFRRIVNARERLSQKLPIALSFDPWVRRYLLPSGGLRESSERQLPT